MRRLLAILLGLFWLASTAHAAPTGGMISEPKCTDVVWGVKPQLTNVLTTAVTLSFMTEAATDIRVEWGASSRNYTDSDEDLAVAAETLTQIDMDGLSGGTRYYYRVGCRLDGQTKWGYTGEYSFKTLESSTSTTFSFAVEADSHIHSRWSAANCGDGSDADFGEVAEFRQTLWNMIARQPSFVVSLGDEAQTHCAACADCAVRGNQSGSGVVASQENADVRYEVMAGEWRLATSYLPFFYALGNHEGETGYHNAEADCNHADIDTYSETARLKYFPNPNDDYDNGAVPNTGNVLTWSSGDADFWILDPFKYYGGGAGRAPSVGTCSIGAEVCTRAYPDPDVDCSGVETCDADTSATFPTFSSDWTLGATQLSWFQTTYAASTAKWKFVFIHHLVGGSGGIEGAGKDLTGVPRQYGSRCYHYGRGSVGAVVQYCSVTTATTCLIDDDCPGGETCVEPDLTDPFKGEWETIHTTLKNNIESGGANYVFLGHDHLWLMGPSKDGVHYMTTTKPNGDQPVWADKDWFQEILYDYDGDDIAEYLDVGGPAGVENGFYLVTVTGSTSVEVEMIRTDIDTPANNNTVVYTYP